MSGGACAPTRLLCLGQCWHFQRSEQLRAQHWTACHALPRVHGWPAAGVQAVYAPLRWCPYIATQVCTGSSWRTLTFLPAPPEPSRFANISVSLAQLHCACSDAPLRTYLLAASSHAKHSHIVAPLWVSSMSLAPALRHASQSSHPSRQPTARVPPSQQWKLANFAEWVSEDLRSAYIASAVFLGFGVITALAFLCWCVQHASIPAVRFKRATAIRASIFHALSNHPCPPCLPNVT